MAFNLSEATQAIRGIQFIAKEIGIEPGMDLGLIPERLALLSPELKDQRWNTLQDWLNKNPTHKKTLNKYLKKPASEILDKLLASLEIDTNLLYLIDSKRIIRNQVEGIIIAFQTLYREREKENV